MTAGTAGATIRKARLQAGLSQSVLAQAAGVAQSVVSAYETGSRQPSLPVLERLVAAAGFELVLDLEPFPAALKRLSGPLGRRVVGRREELRQCAAAHGVSRLRVFGSVARGDENDDSDVDLLADLAPEVGLFDLMRVRRELQDLLGAPVDLVPADGLKPSLRASVQRDMVEL